MAHPKSGQREGHLLMSGRTGTAQTVRASERGEFNLEGRRPRLAASALVTVYGGHLSGQAFLKHSSLRTR